MPAQLSLDSHHFDLKECRSLFMRWVINADRPRLHQLGIYGGVHAGVEVTVLTDGGYGRVVVAERPLATEGTLGLHPAGTQSDVLPGFRLATRLRRARLRHGL